MKYTKYTDFGCVTKVLYTDVPRSAKGCFIIWIRFFSRVKCIMYDFFAEIESNKGICLFLSQLFVLEKSIRGLPFTDERTEQQFLVNNNNSNDSDGNHTSCRNRIYLVTTR